MKKTSTLIALLLSAQMALPPCLEAQSKNIPLQHGHWKGALKNSSGQFVPFTFDVQEVEGHVKAIIQNAAERLETEEFMFSGDSVFFKMPFFDSEFRVLNQGTKMQGLWVRHFPGRITSMPFEASAGPGERFKGKPATARIQKRFAITWEKAKDTSIGEFSQSPSGVVSGSILNLDGDDRYLEGRVCGDSLLLSNFDGSHALLIKARITDSGNLQDGMVYSGISRVRRWSGRADPMAKLPDPYTQTTLRAGEKTLHFSYRNQQGKFVSPHDPAYRGKVLVIQILGSWCPNCMDETAFMSRFYDQHKDKVAVIGLAYERTANADSVAVLLQPFIRRFHVNYPILTTGFTSRTADVMKSLPELQNFSSFPTTIVLDAEGNVNFIHTGFAGPGTGAYYESFVEDFTRRVMQTGNLHK